MSGRLDAGLSIVMALCAIAVAGTAVWRQVTPPGQGDALLPVYVEYWHELTNGGTRLGSPRAPVQVVEFGDLQCPFCGTLRESLDVIAAEQPDAVSLVYYHFPLDIHPSAFIAAVAAECAAASGRFSEMLRVAHARRGELGVASLAQLASDAGVPDTASFRRCLDGDAASARVRSDLQLGRELGVEGTPTVIINGWRLARPPTLDSLRAMVRRVRAGEALFAERH